MYKRIKSQIISFSDCFFTKFLFFFLLEEGVADKKKNYIKRAGKGKEESSKTLRMAL